MTIPTFTLFVSSPSDVVPERALVELVARRLEGEANGAFRFDVVRWEHVPFTAGGTFQVQLPRASAADLVVCLFWKRSGEALPPAYARADGTVPTGSEYEFEDALAAARARGRPGLWVYLKTARVTFDADDVDRQRAQYERLKAFLARHLRPSDGPFLAAHHTFEAADELEGLFEAHLRRWLAARRANVGPEVAWRPEKGSPFRGLRVFEEEHAPVFFGRRRVVERLREALLAAPVPFLLIVGASGTGKSSVVRAGLVPRLLRPAGVEGVDLWRRCVVRPSEGGEGPLSALARALLRPDVLPELAQGDSGDAAALQRLLREAPAAAAGAIAKALERAAMAAVTGKAGLARALRGRLLLVLDQLEELLTLPEEVQARAAAALRALAENGAVWVVATLRGDFYGPLQAVPDLMALKEAGAQYDLLAPGQAELAEMVQGPAEAAGLRYERRPGDQGLDEALIEAADAPGSLPLLQLALDELYARRDAATGTLTWAAYEGFGRLAGVVERRAEAAYAALDPAAQAALRAVLARLVTVAAGDLITARAVAREDAAPDPPAGQLVEHFIAARLIAAEAAGGAAGTGADRRVAIRVAHEALISGWPRASALIEEDRALLAVRARVEEAARQWERGGRQPDELLPAGRRLNEAVALMEERPDLVDAPTAPFVARSRDAEAAERGRAERALRAKVRRTRQVAAVIALLCLVSAGAAAHAWRQGQEAVRQSQEAVRQGREAERRKREAEQRKQEAERSFSAALDTGSAVVDAVGKQQNRGQIRTRAAEDLVRLVGEGYRELNDVRDAPELAAKQAGLLKRIAEFERDLGHSKAALESMEATLGIARRQRDRDPAALDWQRRVAAYAIVSVPLLQGLGRGELARERLAEAEAIYARFNPGPPRDADWSEIALLISGFRSNASSSKLSDLAAYYATGKDRIQILEGLLTENSKHKASLAHSYLAAAQQAAMLGLPWEATLHASRAGQLVAEGLRDTPDSAEWLRIEASKSRDSAQTAKLKGNHQEALRRDREAVGIRQRISEQDPENRADRLAFASARATLADTLRLLGRLDEAIAEADRAVDILEKLAATDPDNIWIQRDLRDAYYNRGFIWADKRSFDAARADVERAASTNRTVLRLAPDEDLALGVAAHYRSAVSLSYLNEGKFAEAETAARAFVEAARAYADRKPADRQSAEFVCRAQGHLAMAMSNTRPRDDEGLLQQYRAERACYAPLLAASPDDGSLLDSVRQIQARLAEALRSRGDAEGALQTSAMAAELNRRRCRSAEDADRQGERATQQVMIGDACAGAARAAKDAGDLAGAAELYRLAVAHVARWVAKNPDNVFGRNTLAGSQSALVAVLWAGRRTEEAEAEAWAAVDRWRELLDLELVLLRRDDASVKMATDFLLSLHSLAEELKAAGRPDEALARLSAAQPEIDRLRERRLLSQDGKNVADVLTKMQSDLVQLRLRDLKTEAENAFADKRFADATLAQGAVVRAVEQMPTGVAQQAALVEALGSLSWCAVLSRDHGLAVSAAERALAIDGGALYIEGNLAHAAMFLGDTDRARAIFMRHRGASILERPWEDVIRADFAEMRSAGLSHLMMAEVEASFARDQPPMHPPSGP